MKYKVALERLKKRGLGKYQFLALQKDIEEMLSQGFTKTAIYDEFKQNGKFTLSYRMFCIYFKSMYMNHDVNTKHKETYNPIFNEDIKNEYIQSESKVSIPIQKNNFVSKDEKRDTNKSSFMHNSNPNLNNLI